MKAFGISILVSGLLLLLGCVAPARAPIVDYYKDGTISALSWLPDNQTLAFIYVSLKEKSPSETHHLDLYTVDLKSRKIRLVTENIIDVGPNHAAGGIYDLRALPDNTLLLTTFEKGIYQLTLDGQVKHLSSKPISKFGLGASLSADLNYLLINSDNFFLTKLDTGKTTTISFKDLENIQLQPHDIAAIQLTGADSQVYFHTLKEPIFYSENNATEHPYRIVHAIADLNFEAAKIYNIRMLDEFHTSEISNQALQKPFLRLLPGWNRPNQLFFYQASKKEVSGDWENTLIAYDLRSQEYLSLPAQKLQEILTRHLSIMTQNIFTGYGIDPSVKLSPSNQYLSYIERHTETILMISDIEGHNSQQLISITRDMPKSGPHIAY